jgi:hypothetical protein
MIEKEDAMTPGVKRDIIVIDEEKCGGVLEKK